MRLNVCGQCRILFQITKYQLFLHQRISNKNTEYQLNLHQGLNMCVNQHNPIYNACLGVFCQCRVLLQNIKYQLPLHQGLQNSGKIISSILVESAIRIPSISCFCIWVKTCLQTKTLMIFYRIPSINCLCIRVNPLVKRLSAVIQQNQQTEYRVLAAFEL